MKTGKFEKWLLKRALFKEDKSIFFYWVVIGPLFFTMMFIAAVGVIIQDVLEWEVSIVDDGTMFFLGIPIIGLSLTVYLIYLRFHVLPRQQKEQKSEDDKRQNYRKQNHNRHGEQFNQKSRKATGNPQKDVIQKAFDTLGLKPGSSPKEIKRQYLELVKKLHPDSNQGSPQFEKLLKDVNQAYDTLKRAGLSL